MDNDYYTDNGFNRKPDKEKKLLCRECGNIFTGNYCNICGTKYKSDYESYENDTESDISCVTDDVEYEYDESEVTDVYSGSTIEREYDSNRADISYYKAIKKSNNKILCNVKKNDIYTIPFIGNLIYAVILFAVLGCKLISFVEDNTDFTGYEFLKEFNAVDIGVICLLILISAFILIALAGFMLFRLVDKPTKINKAALISNFVLYSAIWILCVALSVIGDSYTLKGGMYFLQISSIVFEIFAIGYAAYYFVVLRERV